MFGQKWLYSGKKCSIPENGSIWTKVVVIGEKWLYSGKDGCIRANWLYSDKMVVFGQSGCNRVNWLYSKKSGSIRAKVVIYRNVIVFKQK